jgi:hypothetical protein
MSNFHGNGSDISHDEIIPPSRAGTKIGTSGESDYPFLTEEEIIERMLAWIDHLKRHAGTMRLGVITDKEEQDLLSMLLDL